MGAALTSMSRRVYEYVDQEGNTFYSFTRLPRMISVGKKLTLASRVGAHFQNFLSYMRERALDGTSSEEG